MVELKKVKEKLDIAAKEKIGLEEQIKILRKRRKEFDENLHNMGVEDVSKIDEELLNMETELSEAMKKLDDIEKEDEDDIDIEALLS